MTKPVLILDAHWRRVDELFSHADLATLNERFDVIWGQDAPIPVKALDAALPRAEVLIAATPRVDAETLTHAPKLRAVIEVSGSFPATIDYAACAARNIEVLCCAPGFRQSVAEMAVSMALSGARSLVEEHERFRDGTERWLADNDATDFTLYGATVGFLGYGSIARETHRLLAPFAPTVLAYDPWLPADSADAAGIRLVDLPTLAAACRCLFVTAAPTQQNRGLFDAETIALLPSGALVVLISRAHLVDFDALTQAAAEGRIRAAIDVFPSEPLAPDDPLRRSGNVILSPHRAAAVPGGRQLIGRMILEDLASITSGVVPASLQRAAGRDLSLVAGVGDAQAVADMAAVR